MMVTCAVMPTCTIPSLSLRLISQIIRVENEPQGRGFTKVAGTTIVLMFHAFASHVSRMSVQYKRHLIV
jgi:hypothetical protein